jgi:glycosyltransferase involved in cell wall biosynthesis
VFHASITQEIRLNAYRGKYGVLTPAARLAALALNIVEQWSLRRVSLVLARSRFSQKILRDWVPDAAIADNPIPIGLNTTQYQPFDKVKARDQLGLPDERPILITTRRLVARMGLENLVRAMAIVRDKGIDALLLIAGKGYLQHDLEKLITELGLESNVRLLGFVPEETLPVYLASADLFVLPTEALEGFGLATIEALAVGLPVVGTPVGATPEILRRLDPGLITQSAAPDALAQCLTYWLVHHTERTALSQRSREAVEAYYQDDLVAQQLETLYMRCIGR